MQQNAGKSAAMRYWDSAAARYLELFRDELRDKPFDRELLGSFAAALGKGARVCDAGCGPCAHVARLLADAGLNAVGVDASAECIALARKEQPSLDLSVMDAATLEFPAASFDGIVAYYLLHYLPKSEWPPLLSGFARVLRPGGQLLLAMKEGEGEAWIADPLGGPLPTFWAAGSRAELEEAVVAAGFQLLETRARGAYAAEIGVGRIYLLAARGAVSRSGLA